ncbi:hypothetical protein HY637_05405 [Candidatus Woesearchaeota archaeon]|nr:hypothetical protein [Candidatus Woesearchaeota archaeon]
MTDGDSFNQPTRRQMLGVSLATAVAGFLGGVKTARTLARPDLVSMTHSYEFMTEGYIKMWRALGSANVEFHRAAAKQNPKLAHDSEEFLRLYLIDAESIRGATLKNPHLFYERKKELVASIDAHVADIKNYLSTI